MREEAQDGKNAPKNALVFYNSWRRALGHAPGPYMKKLFSFGARSVTERYFVIIRHWAVEISWHRPPIEDSAVITPPSTATHP